VTADGKKLESWVRFVEETLVPKGWEVKSREKVYDDDGVQIAEFDIQIAGQVRTTQFRWLIECRDRPSEGPQAGGWIEQLAGRRDRFGFDRVTAVSTTGFTRGAFKAAESLSVELRELSELADGAAQWLGLTFIGRIERRYKLTNAMLLVDLQESEARKSALLRAIRAEGGRVLRAITTGVVSTGAEAFMGTMETTGEGERQFATIRPGETKPVQCHVEYVNDEDHFVVDTDEGPVRIRSIDFSAELSIHESVVPLTEIREYRISDSGEVIAQIASFAEMDVHGMKVAFEMHHFPKEGTHIALRKTKC